jgi:hypothetical protein
MRKLPWFRIAVGLALALVLVGIAPLAYMTWEGRAGNLQPLSMPLPQKAGEYTSLFFATNFYDDYQIDIYFLRPGRKPLDIDWKIVDETGATLAGGHYRETAMETGGNVVSLERNYRPKRGVRQRAVVTLHQDIDAPISGDTRLYIDQPEKSLEVSYAGPAAMMWAAAFTGTGVVILFLLMAHRVAKPQSQMN